MILFLLFLRERNQGEEERKITRICSLGLYLSGSFFPFIFFLPQQNFLKKRKNNQGRRDNQGERNNQGRRDNQGERGNQGRRGNQVGKDGDMPHQSRYAYHNLYPESSSLSKARKNPRMVKKTTTFPDSVRRHDPQWIYC